MLPIPILLPVVDKTLGGKVEGKLNVFNEEAAKFIICLEKKFSAEASPAFKASVKLTDTVKLFE